MVAKLIRFEEALIFSLLTTATLVPLINSILPTTNPDGGISTTQSLTAMGLGLPTKVETCGSILFDAEAIEGVVLCQCIHKTWWNNFLNEYDVSRIAPSCLALTVIFGQSIHGIPSLLSVGNETMLQ